MNYEISWMKPDRVLMVRCYGHQNEEAIRSCLDGQLEYLDAQTEPIIVVVDWRDVIETDQRALLNLRGHRTYSHPMVARGVLVGMARQEQFENEVSAFTTRESKRTQYFKTMEEVLDYIQNYLNMPPAI